MLDHEQQTLNIQVLNLHSHFLFLSVAFSMCNSAVDRPSQNQIHHTPHTHTLPNSGAIANPAHWFDTHLR